MIFLFNAVSYMHNVCYVSLCLAFAEVSISGDTATVTLPASISGRILCTLNKEQFLPCMGILIWYTCHLLLLNQVNLVVYFLICLVVQTAWVFIMDII